MSDRHRKINSALVALAGLVLAVWLSGCNPFTVAAKATLGARQAADAIDKGIAAATDAEDTRCTSRCTKAGQLSKPCYAECTAKFRKSRDAWRKVAAPAISAAITAAYHGIKLAEAAKQKPEQIMPLVLQAFCGVAKALKELAPVLPESWRNQAAAYLALAEGMVCK
jgi:hypothetical protein